MASLTACLPKADDFTSIILFTKTCCYKTCVRYDDISMFQKCHKNNLKCQTVWGINWYFKINVSLIAENWNMAQFITKIHDTTVSKVFPEHLPKVP